MADMVTNDLTFRGCREDLEKVFTHIGSSEAMLDFNSIIPMPKSLNVECSTNTNMALFAYLSDWGKILFEDIPKSSYTEKGESFQSILPDDFYYKRMLDYRGRNAVEDEKQRLYLLGKQVADNIAKYEYMTWYKWCIENWGCKWNAGNVESLDFGKSASEFSRRYTFQTAYNVPVPIYMALKEYILDNRLNVTFSVSAYYDCDYSVVEFCMDDLTEDFNVNNFRYIDDEE